MTDNDDDSCRDSGDDHTRNSADEPSGTAADTSEDGPVAESGPGRGPAEDVPTIACSRCDAEWTLTYELESLQVGNQAVEQFALDHKRHTGHFPDDVTTWQARCRRCPERVDRLAEGPARRWARTHARHTNHAVVLDHASLAESVAIEDKSK